MKTKLPVLFSAAVFCSCALAQNAAVVNGEALPKSTMDQWVNEYVAQGGKDTPEVRQAFLQDMIMGALIEQEAAKRKLTESTKVKVALQLAKNNVLQQALLADELAKNPITEKDLKARYDQEKAELGSKEFNVSHILVKDKKTADDIQGKLAKGEKFEDLAKKYSLDEGASSNGGELGWNRPAIFVEEFADALRKMKKGETTKNPVRTEFGWHVIRVNDIRDVPLPEFSAVKKQIREGLLLQKQQNFLEDLKNKAKIEIPKTK